MEVVDTRDTRMDALCEVCGSADFKELLCQCSQCNNCNEHVYCMHKNIPYIPDTWTCDGCLPTSGGSYDPMYDIVSEDDEETSVEMDQSDDELNYDEQEERVPVKASSEVGNFQLEEIGDEVLTGASRIVDNDCHSGEQGMEVTLAAAGNTHCDSHSEEHWMILAQGSLRDTRLDLQSTKVPLEDSVMADVDYNSDVQVMIVALKASGKSDNDSHLEVQSQVMGDADSESQLEVHGKMVSPRASGFGDGGPPFVELGKKVPSEACSAANCNSHSAGLSRIIPPKASGATSEHSCLVEQIKEFSPKASEIANKESSFRQQDKKHVQKVVGIVISDAHHSAEQGNKVPPKAFTYCSAPPLCVFIDALTDMRAQFKAEKEKIDNLAMKMRHSEDELHALLKKMDEVRSRTTHSLGVKKWLRHNAR